jgi:hypothetical protein
MKLRIPMIVAVRSFAMALKQDTEAKSEKSTDRRTRRKRLNCPSSYTLIFDTETSVDHAQNFRIGTYQVRKGGEGLVL